MKTAKTNLHEKQLFVSSNLLGPSSRKKIYSENDTTTTKTQSLGANLEDAGRGSAERTSLNTPQSIYQTNDHIYITIPLIV